MDEAVRRYLAWDSIVKETKELDLTPHQVTQAENQRESADKTVAARLPEAYKWLLVPVQQTPQSDIEWQAFPLSGDGPLAFRASKKLRGDELLITSFAGTRLRMELDRVLWRGDYVAIKQLVEDFARYLYLPRLADSQVLLASVERDSFAYADTYDDAAERYRGLRAPAHVLVDGTSGLLVKPAVARKQMDADAGAATAATASASPTTSPAAATTGGATGSAAATAAAATAAPALPKRFHGSATLDPTRVGRDAGRIADEVVAHLAGLMGSRVTVTLEIQADVASGVPEKVVRTVTENCRTLKFNDQGFEES